MKREVRFIFVARKEIMKHYIVILITICLSIGQLKVKAQVATEKLIACLDSISYTDQLYRGDSIERATQKFGWNAEQTRAIWKKQDYLDRLNMKKVDSLIAIFGYPGKTLVGKERRSIVFLVIQHGELADQEKYLPILTKAADQDELAWYSLALMVDRIRTGHGKEQLYGTQLNVAGQGMKIFPIADELNVNVRRAKIGLGPLESYLKEFGVNYILPDKNGNKNPTELYVKQVAEENSPVELIGGQDALFATLKYPQAAKDKGITGRVTLQFTIDPSGKPKDLEVVKSLTESCDQEALRVMKTAKFTNSTGADHEIRMSLPFPYSK